VLHGAVVISVLVRGGLLRGWWWSFLASLIRRSGRVRLKLEGCARTASKGSLKVDIVVIINERACSIHLGRTPQVGAQ
jgi:hypothetical protein